MPKATTKTIKRGPGRPPEVPVKLTNSRSKKTRTFPSAYHAARFLKGDVNRDDVRNAANRTRHHIVAGTNYTATFA